MNYQKEKHFRYQGFDYSADGYYFVTICTDNRRLFFGKIIDGKSELSAVGEIAKKCWLDIPSHFPFVELDEFVVMPNHVHGIIYINRGVGTQDFAFLHNYKNKFGPQSGNLSSIIRGFKIGVFKNSKPLNNDFSWQPRFHDRIIRNGEELNAIKQYIMDNPLKWHLDRNNPENILRHENIPSRNNGTQDIAFLRSE
jgi:putative transposase